MNEQDVKDLIEAFIVANGVNAITADVLRPILIAMLTQPNDEIGDLTQLNTVTQDNLVDAINEIYNSILSITNDGIKLYQGDADPNVEPPDSYNIADFYFEEGNDLWQFNGTEWVRANSIFLQNSGYKETKFPYVGSLNFTIPENVQAIIVKKNGNPTENKENWTQLGNVVTYLGTMEAGDYLLITGVYVIPSGGGGGGGGGCITAECVESLPTFDNDLEAASLPNYTPYKTNTGEIRYKLPGTMPPSSEWIDEEEWIDESEWID